MLCSIFSSQIAFADNMLHRLQRLQPSLRPAEMRRRLRPDATAAAADDWQVRCGPLMGLPAVLTALGVPTAPVLAECGLPSDALDDAERWLPFGDATRLLQAAAQHSGRPDIGLRVAATTGVDVFGLLGMRMSVAPTVGAALRVLRREFHLHDRGAVPYLSMPGAGRAALGYALSRYDTPGLAMVYDVAIGVGLKMMRTLCGPGFRPLAVSFAYRAPADARPYLRSAGAPVTFDASHTQIEFDAAWLDQPLQGGEAAARDLLQAAASGTDTAGSERSLRQRTLSVAQALLMTGGLSETRIATELALHVRTLHRRLAAEGGGVKAVIAQVRYEQARHLLSQTHLPLVEVAQALQYTDVASFSRAFKAWAGVAPGRWRAAQVDAAALPLKPPAAP